MYTPRTDVTSLFDLSKLLCNGRHLTPEFKTELNKLITVYPMNSNRLHGRSSTIGQQTITHDEARYYCMASGYKIPRDIKEPASIEGLKQQLLRLKEDEAMSREALTKLLAYLDEEYIAWPAALPKPPHNLKDLIDEVLEAGMDCSKPEALIAADKLTESRNFFLINAEILHELEQQLRTGGYGDHNA